MIYGPKYVGKTFTALEYAKSVYYMQELGTKNNELFEINNANIIFDGLKPRLIDEWQICPKTWDRVRFLIDMSQNKSSKHILTGSSFLDKYDVIHSGAGRIARIKLSTLTISEKLHNK